MYFGQSSRLVISFLETKNSTSRNGEVLW